MNPIQLIIGGGLVLLSLVSMQCATTKTKGEEPVTLAFYNVENLFDTLDDANHADEDFTQEGKQQWNADRYRKKLTHLADVIAAMGHPTIIGFAEIENRTVLKDLCETGSLAEYGYQIAHFDSPDHRGIDVGLIYQTRRFSGIEVHPIPVHIDDQLVAGYTTRDILNARLRTGSGKSIQILVNHWPSRRDGPEISENRRMQVAHQARTAIDEIQRNEPDAFVVIMGDFNDEPVDRTIREVIRAGAESDSSALLFNAMWTLDQQNKGTYNYRGEWNMFDQIILSRNFLTSKSQWSFDSTTVFSEPFMMYNDPKYGPLPNRTFGGTRYFGGYSDHLPVMVTIH